MSRLERIHGTENAQRRGDVVFVHGLNGDARTTWHPKDQPNNFWPDWIGADIPNIGVWSIGYEASSFGWAAGSTMPLADRAVNALFLLDTYGIGTERPVVFITHSLGGLLIKEMLRKAIDNSVPEGRQLAERTRGVIFLSTPHTGSDLAHFVDYMKFLLPTESVKELKPNEPRLRELNTWYRNNVNKLGIKTQVYCERKPTTAGKGWFKGRFGAVVVDVNSSDPGLEGVTAIPLDEDHLTISCPKRESAQYKGISKFVQACFVASASVLEQPIYLETPGGKIPLNSPLYMRREPWESLSLEEIKKDAGLIRIRAPRQTGKTSLLVRINDHARQQGYTIVSLSFQALEESFFTDLGQFLQTFCHFIGDALKVPGTKVETYWAENNKNSAKITCSNCFRDRLLSAVPGVLVLALDEVDVLFPYAKIAGEFFQMLRFWNEEGKEKEDWARLRLILTHSTEVYVAMKVNSSPFNIGLPVELTGFGAKEVTELAKRHQLDWQEEEVEELMAVVGGHPYMVRLAMWHLAQGLLSFAQIIESAATDAGIYSEHLGRLLGILEDYPPLKEAFITVIRSEQPISLEKTLSFKLHGMGLITKNGNLVSLRYPRLYRPYFCNQFGLP
jgi:protein SERAC1